MSYSPSWVLRILWGQRSLGFMDYMHVGSLCLFHRVSRFRDWDNDAIPAVRRFEAGGSGY